MNLPARPADADTVFYLVADVRIKPEHTAEFMEKIAVQIEKSRAEAGCVAYDMHVDTEDVNHLVFYEVWQTYDVWLEHMDTPHNQAHNTSTAHMVEGVVLTGLTKGEV